MRAIQIKTTGGPEVMELVELPTPKPATRQVLVKIEASGVNFIDTYLREGRLANLLIVSAELLTDRCASVS